MLRGGIFQQFKPFHLRKTKTGHLKIQQKLLQRLNIKC